jgi:NAD(P)-dependent dehydrogenase (short-subunit alcohol dehydrogenase family)
MDTRYLEDLFQFSGRVAAITGGGGVLCGEMSRALARLGVKVAVLDIWGDGAKKVANEIVEARGEAIGVACDVLDKTSLESARDEVLAQFGRVDILINGAGGNKKQASTSQELSFFELPSDAIRWVFDLNLLGTIFPSQIFGKSMVEQGGGSILNVSSMNAFRPLTRTPAYAAAKAAVSNFTQWLAVHMAQEYSPHIRVNAIAPGFLLTEQNRFLLTDEATGNLTPRGRTIIEHTPMGRFGDSRDLIGTIIWLLSPDASSLVTGIVVPVDGGFSAFSGV